MAVEFYLQLVSAALFFCALVIGFVGRGSEVKSIFELCRGVSLEAFKLCLCLVKRRNFVRNAALYRAGKVAQRVGEAFYLLSMTFLTSSALYTAKTRSTKNIASTQAKMIIAAESSSCEKQYTTIGCTR